MKSTIPTGITAYRDPATGEVSGSYPTPRSREILKLANEMASNRDGYGVAFYNDALLAFANKITADAEEEAARWRKASEANIGENVELRQLLQNMEAARDAALRLKVERQPELGRIADALCEYNERDDQDAGRYRWLRKHAAARLRRIAQDLTWMQSARGTDGKLNVAHPEIQAMLDEEIDNAMAAQADANKTPNAEVTGRPLADGPVDRRVRRHG